MYIFTIIKSNVKSECMENVKHTMYKAQAHSLNRGVSLLSNLDGPFFLSLQIFKSKVHQVCALH